MKSSNNANINRSRITSKSKSANRRESSAVTQQQLEFERERDVISTQNDMIKTVKVLDAKLADILDKSNKVHPFGESDERVSGEEEGKRVDDDGRREVNDVEDGDNQESLSIPQGNVDGKEEEEEEYSPPSFATAALSNHGFIDKDLFEKTVTYYKQVFKVNETVFELNSASSGIDKVVRKNTAFLGLSLPLSLSHTYINMSIKYVHLINIL